MYIDVMVAPVKTDQKARYTELCEKMAPLFLENGAQSYVEGWAEDVPVGELTSFPRAVKLADDETCTVAVITYADKAARDACMGAVMSNPEAEKLMQDIPMDGKRMIFGGYEVLMSV